MRGWREPVLYNSDAVPTPRSSRPGRPFIMNRKGQCTPPSGNETVRDPGREAEDPWPTVPSAGMKDPSAEHQR